MARRNPSGISPILAARGYGARVLWPQYTPGGGVNSGSEIPVPPRNTLQNNQSNLIETLDNPFTPRVGKKSSMARTRYNPLEELEPGIGFRWNPEPAARLSDRQLADLKEVAVAVLQKHGTRLNKPKKRIAHAEARAAVAQKLGVPEVNFRLYVAILRSGRKAHVPMAHDDKSKNHIARLTMAQRETLHKEAVRMLKAGYSHKQTRAKLKLPDGSPVGYYTYLYLARHMTNPFQYGPIE
jgi:hypothetical protein